MRKWLVVSGCALLMAGSVVRLDGQKGKTQPTLVNVEFLSVVDDDGVAVTPEVPTAVWSPDTLPGQVGPGLSTSPGTICVANAVSLFAAAGEYAPSSDCGSGGPGVNAFGSVPIGEEYARQASISWVDSRGWEYRLQYGDAFTQPDPPNYAHVVCTGTTAAGVCHAGSVDTTSGTFKSGEAVVRVTGALARLSVRTGSGKREYHELGIFDVPYAIKVTER